MARHSHDQWLRPLDLSPVFRRPVAGLVSSSTTSSVTLGSSILEIENSANETFAGNISGATGQLRVIGTGTFTLSGTNSYTGLTKVTSGTLADGAADAFAPSSTMEVDSGATLAVTHDEGCRQTYDRERWRHRTDLERRHPHVKRAGRRRGFNGTITGTGRFLWSAAACRA